MDLLDQWPHTVYLKILFICFSKFALAKNKQTNKQKTKFETAAVIELLLD